MEKFILETFEKYPKKKFKIEFKDTYLYKYLYKKLWRFKLKNIFTVPTLDCYDTKWQIKLMQKQNLQIL